MELGLLLSIITIGSLCSEVNNIPIFGSILKGQYTPEIYGDGKKIIFSNGISFDTKLLGKNGEPDLPADLKTQYRDNELGYYIVQFTEPIYGPEKDWLGSQGAKIHFYVPNYGFVISLKGKTQQNVVLSNPSVNWMGIYQPAYKISGLFDTVRDENKVTILLFPDADITGVLNEIKEITCRKNFIISDNGINKIIQGVVNKKDINSLARIKGIYWIEPYIEPELCNIDVQWILQDAEPNVRKIWDKGICGEGEIVNSVDAGIYTTHYAHCSGSPPVSNFGHYPDHNAIVVYDSAGPYCVFGGSSHGTFTAGTLTGDDTLTPGNSLYDGIAKRSRLYHSQLGGNGSTFFIFPDLNDLYIRPYNLYYPPTRAYISSNQWGADVAGRYTAHCQQVDQFMWSHKDFLILSAVGSSGPGPGTVGSPASAKNCIAVGATGNRTSGYTQYQSYNSRGPTVDGRLKPTVLAPGGPVTSSGNPPNGYITMSGTSVATPGASGAGVLVRQYLREGWYPNGKKNAANSWSYISSAMVKAILINCADPNVGNYTVPDNNIGWGRIDLDSTLYFDGDLRKTLLYDDTIGLLTGETKDFYFNIPSSSANLKITLVWTDYPGNPVVLKQLVNDLDLYVRSPSGTYYRGNQYSQGQSIPNPSVRDTLNVEECVRVNAPDSGDWFVRIEGRNIPFGPQPFALVITYTGSGTAGFVSLDKPVYRANDFIIDTVRIRVEDLNYGSLGIHDTLLVSIRGKYIETQPETLKCLELAESAYVFKGEIPLLFRGAVHNDGKLSVCQGDTIYVSYTDNNPPFISQVWAGVDAWYFLISNVHCENIEAHSVDVCWNTNEGSNSKVYYGTNPNNLNQVVSVDTPYVLFHRVKINGLEENMTYYYDVESRDFRGNTVRDNNGGLHYSFTSKKATLTDVLVVLLNNHLTGEEFAHPEFLRNALSSGGWTYNWWSTKDMGQFRRDDLKWYKAIFFQVGQENYPVWTIAQKETIKLYHDGGARFVVTGHDIAWDPWNNSPSADTLFCKDYLHYRFIGDIYSSTWNTLRGISGDPISGDYTTGAPYQPFRAGAVADAILLSGTGAAGIGSYVWHGNAANDSCGIRWESTNNMGTPGDGIWGGHKTRVVANCFEITQIDTTNPNSPIRNDIINKTLIWLIGHDHPDVVINSPVSDTTYTTSPIIIDWNATAYGGAEIDTIRIEYSPDGGQTWCLIIADTGLVAPYQWDVSNIQNGNRYRMRITVNDKGVYPSLIGSATTGNFRINIPGNDNFGPRVIPNSIVVANNPKFVTPDDTLLPFTAVVSDSQSGLSTINSAQYFAKSGNQTTGELPMTVSDGQWDEIEEGVNGTIRLVYTPGVVNICSLFVRGCDSLQNLGMWYHRTFTLIDGDIRMTGVIEDMQKEFPIAFALYTPMPNPTRGKTNIVYAIPHPSKVSLRIYNCLGQVVRVLLEKEQEPGVYQIIWDGDDFLGRRLPAGVYFIKFEAGGAKKIKKTVLLR
ncbi:MAG: S8 family serine peptidase [candidate division WOR-3 bacterium]